MRIAQKIVDGRKIRRRLALLVRREREVRAKPHAVDDLLFEVRVGTRFAGTHGKRMERCEMAQVVPGDSGLGFDRLLEDSPVDLRVAALDRIDQLFVRIIEECSLSLRERAAGFHRFVIARRGNRPRHEDVRCHSSWPVRSLLR